MSKKKSKKKIKNWLASYSDNGLMGTLRNTFIHTPKTPRAAQMHEWNTIERKQRENHPIACFLLNDIPRYLRVKQMRISDAIWWVKYRVMKEHNHHTVDTGLEPGYHMSEEILLHSSMAVLVDFVDAGHGEKDLAHYIEECEAALNPKNWQEWERKQPKKYKEQRIFHDTANLNGCKEILAIYRWWKYDRATEHLALEQEKDAHYAAKEFDFMEDERDPSKLTGAEKKRYEASIKHSMDLHDVEESLWRKDTDMLARLAKARRYMW